MFEQVTFNEDNDFFTKFENLYFRPFFGLYFKYLPLLDTFLFSIFKPNDRMTLNCEPKSSW